jgi:type II secretory pathway pseudopilin PulG
LFDIAYAYYMKHLQRGFTVIELLIIVLTVAVLTTIVVSGWQQANKSAKNKARETDAREWAGAFDVYKGRFGAWPILPDNSNMISACLGRFDTTTNNKCDQYTSGSGANVIDATDVPSQTILTEIAKAGSVPTNGGGIINDGTRGAVGPFVYMHQTGPDANGDVTVNGAFIAFFEGTTCPTDFYLPSALPSGSDPSLNAKLTSLPNGVIACALPRTTTYNSN